MSIVKEFRQFAMRGNVVDLAVAVIIAVAFGKIVASFVADILMPPIGMLLGGVEFTDLVIVLREARGEDIPAVTITYGVFIQNVVDFIIIAFAVFMMVRTINNMKKKEEAIPEPPPGPTKEEVLLTEIRDLLKK
jgi:large conductance mechanosensitive channel